MIRYIYLFSYFYNDCSIECNEMHGYQKFETKCMYEMGGNVSLDA